MGGGSGRGLAPARGSLQTYNVYNHGAELLHNPKFVTIYINAARICFKPKFCVKHIYNVAHG
jgi:hypothetical protein